MKSTPYILIVDENPLICRLFGSKLADAGFEVMYAHDGNKGREMARRFQPDLVLLDVRMPIMDGFSTAEHLKKERETAHIPLIFLTNEDFSLDAEKAVKDKLVVDYIHKSIDLNEFVERIKKVFETLKH